MKFIENKIQSLSLFKKDSVKALEQSGLQNFNYDDSKYRVIGYCFVITIFIIFGGWSYLAKLESAVLASAIVKVESFKKKIQHLEGGLVQKIYIKEGELVKKSQLLLKLDDTQIIAKLRILQDSFNTLNAQKSRLVAERDGLSIIPFKESLNLTEQLQKIYKRQQQIFKANLDTRNGEKDILQHRIQQLESSIYGFQGLVKSKNQRISSPSLSD